jgi:hypothetical protein
MPPLLPMETKLADDENETPFTCRKYLSSSTLVFVKMSHPATVVQELENHCIVRWAAGGESCVDKDQITEALWSF